jgi:hypothetical protein
VEQSGEDVDLEQNFQLNSILESDELDSSTLCFLVATNPGHDGYRLHLALRQRFLKGNFRCLTIGSLKDLTFPVSSLGSNFNRFNDVTKGSNLICQDLRLSKNPFFVYNGGILKRNDRKNISSTFIRLSQYSTLSGT